MERYGMKFAFKDLLWEFPRDFQRLPRQDDPRPLNRRALFGRERGELRVMARLPAQEPNIAFCSPRGSDQREKRIEREPALSGGRAQPYPGVHAILISQADQVAS